MIMALIHILAGAGAAVLGRKAVGRRGLREVVWVAAAPPRPPPPASRRTPARRRRARDPSARAWNNTKTNISLQEQRTKINTKTLRIEQSW